MPFEGGGWDKAMSREGGWRREMGHREKGRHGKCSAVEAELR